MDNLFFFCFQILNREKNTVLCPADYLWKIGTQRDLGLALFTILSRNYMAL